MYAMYVGLNRYSCVISSSGLEWVFFNAAQVLPCYVIQVYEDNKKIDQHFPVPPPLASLAEGSLQRSNSDESPEKKKKRLKARVRES